MTTAVHVKQARIRGWVAGIVTLACLQAWLSGLAGADCLDAFSMFFSPIELEVLVPIVGICVAACVSASAIIASMRVLRRQAVAVIVAVYVVGASLLLATLTTSHPSRAWAILPVLGSAVVAVAVGLAVRRVHPGVAAALGLLAAAACFAITSAITPFTGASSCGFAP